MNFQNIKPVDGYKFYLDLAFRRAREKGTKLRGQKLKGGRIEKSKYIELMKMQVISDTICARMQSIINSFPNLDDLDPFYSELLRLHLDYAQLKRSLGAVNWLRQRAYNMLKIYRSKLDKNRDFDRINPIKTEFLGRISSMVKQLKKDFEYLEASRKVLKGFPTIKTGLKTIAIAGFPNVGKTTLLHKLTGSKAEINSYPFTTKALNVGYVGKGKDRIQLIDTPGTLDRFEKMNDIERVAYLAIKHLASKIIYVYDLTEEYPLNKQIALYQRLKKDFELEIVNYLSKTDIVHKADLEQFQKRYKAVTDPDQIKDMI